MSDFLSRVESILSGVMNFNPKSRVERLLMKWVGSVGNVEDLETDDKTSIVAAINEIAESGGGLVVNFSIEYSEGEITVSADKTPTEALSAALTGPVVGVATINVSDTIRTMPLGNVVYTLSNIAAFLPIGIDDDGNFVYFVYADSDGWVVNLA